MRSGSAGSIDDTVVKRKTFGAAKKNLFKVLEYLIENPFEHVISISRLTSTNLS